jgi:hypothetical protein
MTDELKNRIKSFLKEQECGYIGNEDDEEYDPIDFENVANLDMFLETAIGLLKESIGE